MYASPIVAPREPVSILSIISFVVGVVTAVGYLSVKTIVPIFDQPTFDKQIDGIATVFAILGFLSLLPIAAAIVLGHLGVRAKSGPRRWRSLGVAGLAVGYLLLALYANRVIVAGIATVTFPHGGGFLENNFFWS